MSIENILKLNLEMCGEGKFNKGLEEMYKCLGDEDEDMGGLFEYCKRKIEEGLSGVKV